jgi:hypothetical protein
MTNYMIRVGSAMSQLGNAALLNGHPNESISGRCYRERWTTAEAAINRVFAFFGQEDHCLMAHVNERLWAREVLTDD